jgi:hypothetical protein
MKNKKYIRIQSFEKYHIIVIGAVIFFEIAGIILAVIMKDILMWTYLSFCAMVVADLFWVGSLLGSNFTPYYIVGDTLRYKKKFNFEDLNMREVKTVLLTEADANLGVPLSKLPKKIINADGEKEIVNGTWAAFFMKDLVYDCRYINKNTTQRDLKYLKDFDCRFHCELTCALFDCLVKSFNAKIIITENAKNNLNKEYDLTRLEQNNDIDFLS